MATTGMVTEDRSVSVGRVFSRSFSIMGRHAPLVFGIALLLGALPAFLFSYAMIGIRFDLQQRGVITGFAALSIVAVIAMILFQALIQGAIVHAALRDREGRPAHFWESVGYAFSRSLPLIAVSLLFVIAAAIGMLLLIIPFFLVATRWAVAPTAVVAERRGVGGAFARSAELTAGARWKVLGCGLLAIILMWLVAALAGAINVMFIGIQNMATGGGVSLIVLAVNAVFRTITSAFWSSAQAALYIELRDWKDGPTTDRLADIFA